MSVAFRSCAAAADNILCFSAQVAWSMRPPSLHCYIAYLVWFAPRMSELTRGNSATLHSTANQGSVRGKRLKERKRGGGGGREDRRWGEGSQSFIILVKRESQLKNAFNNEEV